MTAFPTPNHFPPEILVPWQTHAAEQVPDWDAHIFPLVPEAHGVVTFTLRREIIANGVTYVAALSGTDQEQLLDEARRCDRAWQP